MHFIEFNWVIQILWFILFFRYMDYVFNVFNEQCDRSVLISMHLMSNLKFEFSVAPNLS